MSSIGRLEDDVYGDYEGLIDEELHRCPECGSVMIRAAQRSYFYLNEAYECKECGYTERIY